MRYLVHRSVNSLPNLRASSDDGKDENTSFRQGLSRDYISCSDRTMLRPGKAHPSPSKRTCRLSTELAPECAISEIPQQFEGRVLCASTLVTRCWSTTVFRKQPILFMSTYVAGGGDNNSEANHEEGIRRKAPNNGPEEDAVSAGNWFVVSPTMEQPGRRDQSNDHG